MNEASSQIVQGVNYEPPFSLRKIYTVPFQDRTSSYPYHTLKSAQGQRCEINKKHKSTSAVVKRRLVLKLKLRM